MFKKLLMFGLLVGCLDLSAAATTDNSGLLKDFDSLGGNKELLNQVGPGQAQLTTKVVQERVVNRRNRVELGLEYGSVLGGDSYDTATNYGINANYHINPHWSLGAKYAFVANKLKAEGQNLIDSGIIPEIDYAKSETLGMVNFYPIYGKMNLYDLGVVHFDIYALAGYGSIALKSGSKSTWIAGGGIGFWFSQRLTTRLEAYYQTYDAQRYDGPSKMNLTVGSVQVGILL